MLWCNSKSHVASPEFRISFYSKTWKLRPDTVCTSQWWQGKVSDPKDTILGCSTNFWEVLSSLLKTLGRQDAQRVANVDSKVHVSYVLTGWILKLPELSQISPVYLTARLSASSSVKIISTSKWNGSIPCCLHNTWKIKGQNIFL